MEPRTRPRLAWIVLPAALALTLGGTLVPTTDPEEQWTFWCLFCGDQGVSDVLSNILLFVPLGVGLGLFGRRPVPAWLLATGLSLAIEIAQLAIPGRWSAAGDVVFNGLGGGLGAWAVALAPTALVPRTSLAPWLSLAAGAAATAIFVAAAPLFGPAFPRTTWWGQWTPPLEGLEVYEGRVLDARVGTLPLPSFRLPRSDSVRALLLSGAPLEAVAVAGPPPPGLASLVSIADERNRQILLVGPDVDDVVFTYRSTAAALGMSRTSFRLGEWLADVRPGDTLRVAVRRAPPGTCVTVNARTTCDLGFTVGRGWGAIHNLEIFPWLPHPAVSVLWISVWMLPLGLWARRHPATILGAACAVSALALTPPLTGLLFPTPWWEWLGAGIGVAVGVALRRRADKGSRERR